MNEGIDINFDDIIFIDLLISTSIVLRPSSIFFMIVYISKTLRLMYAKELASSVNKTWSLA